MKSANPALLQLFSTDQPFEQFDLYTFTLASGIVDRYTNCGFDVVYGGNTWLCARSPGGLVIDEASDTGPRAHWSAGFSAGSWEVTILPRGTDVTDVRNGLLQEATCRVDRGYVLAWPQIPTLSIVPVGLVNIFSGRVAEVDFGRSSVQITLNDPRELLDIQMPRNILTAQCRYALFSPQCTLSKAAFGQNVSVAAVTSNQQFTVTPQPAVADNYFALGDLTFTSGQNNKSRMMIRSSVFATGALTLMAPLPFTVAPGDNLTIYPGCDKTVSTCDTKFNNKLNHGGFTLIPAAETAV